MVQRKSVLAVAAATLALTLGASAAAQTPSTIGYWVDSRGHVVRNGYNECWRAGYWTPALAIPPDGHPNSPVYGHLKLPHLN